MITDPEPATRLLLSNIHLPQLVYIPIILLIYIKNHKKRETEFHFNRALPAGMTYTRKGCIYTAPALVPVQSQIYIEREIIL